MRNDSDGLDRAGLWRIDDHAAPACRSGAQIRRRLGQRRPALSAQHATATPVDPEPSRMGRRTDDRPPQGSRRRLRDLGRSKPSRSCMPTAQRPAPCSGCISILGFPAHRIASHFWKKSSARLPLRPACGAPLPAASRTTWPPLLSKAGRRATTSPRGRAASSLGNVAVGWAMLRRTGRGRTSQPSE